MAGRQPADVMTTAALHGGGVPSRLLGGTSLPERIVERRRPGRLPHLDRQLRLSHRLLAGGAVLQPDLAFAACAPSRAPLELVSYAARRFTALPHTTVYIDGGIHYWPSFSQAVWMLEQAGIGSVRGFALNTTEYDSTGAELEYGARLDQALAAAGFAYKHFVINTAENGAPFLNGQCPW